MTSRRMMRGEIYEEEEPEDAEGSKDDELM